MDAVNVIIPVVFMLGLGFFACKKNILSAEHNAGLKKLIFSILLPILVFTAVFVGGYLIIWAVIYVILRRSTARLNARLKKVQEG